MAVRKNETIRSGMGRGSKSASVWSSDQAINSGTAKNIFLGNKAPVAAVKAHITIVAHGEVAAFRNDQVGPLQMRGISCVQSDVAPLP